MLAQITSASGRQRPKETTKCKRFRDRRVRDDHAVRSVKRSNSENKAVEERERERERERKRETEKSELLSLE